MGTENPDWGDFDHFHHPSTIHHASTIHPTSCNDQESPTKTPTKHQDHPRNCPSFLLGVKTADDITSHEGVDCLSRMGGLLEGGLLEECFSVPGGGGCSEHVRISLVDNDLIWQRVLENFGCLLPVEWNKSCFNVLTKEVLHIDEDKQNNNGKDNKENNNKQDNKENNNKETNNNNKDNNNADSFCELMKDKEGDGEGEVKNSNVVMNGSLHVSQLSTDSLDNDDGDDNDDDDEIIKSELSNINSKDIRCIGNNKKIQNKNRDKINGNDDDDDDDDEGSDDDDDDDVNLDMHSLVLSPNGTPRNEVKSGDDDDAPMFTAEQVISEIEEMMEEMAAEDEKDVEDEDGGGRGGDVLSLKKVRDGGDGACYDNIPLRKLVIGDVSNRSVMELGELYEEMEGLVGEYSDALIAQLALRDQLEYDLEIKNRFISLFLKLQKKKRALMAKRKSSGLAKPLDMASLSVAEKVYLTTTIPYNHHNQPPSSQLLSTYLKILRAMDEEDINLPLILTQYILKVVCPT